LVNRAPDLVEPGCYILNIRLSSSRDIRVGRLGEFSFDQGWYYYVGSARGGLARRLARYIRESRGVRWHIDFLLRFAKLEGIWYLLKEKEAECEVSRLLRTKAEAGPKGFGSSDCGCRTHLYRTGARAERLEGILEAGGWRYLGQKELEVGRVVFETEKEV
jgi:Uri superfamily endonuclease